VIPRTPLPPAPRAIALTLLALALPGCAVNHRPAATIASLSAEAAPIRIAERATVDTIIERLAQRAVKRGDRTLDILLLSGGGQMGAYGAGFLRGWRTRTETPLPRFDLVTGISTGALQSVFALVGTESALDTLSALYKRAGDRIAPTVDWFSWLRRTGGVVNTKRYRNSIAQLLDEGMQGDLRAAFAEGRQLAVSSADYDLGIGRTWDLAREIDTTRAGRERVGRILLAATAIPGIFPPVVIDDHVHGDGGVIANLLPVLDLAGYRRLASRLKAVGMKEPVTVRLWAILNIFTHPPIAVMNPASRKAIGARGTTLLFWSHQPQQLRALEELSRAVSADVPGLRLEMHFTAIPQELSLDPAASKLFQTSFMLQLERLGYDRARSVKPWDTVVSPFERP